MALVRLLPGRLHAWEVVVGLEVHAQVTSVAKLFSRASAAYTPDARPNSQVAPFDAALPGTLPYINRGVVRQAVRAGLAVGGNVQRVSAFERKHYMYADLPHGYQITQNQAPVVRGGRVAVDVPLRNKRGRKLRETARTWVDIDRIQLEIDSGKSHHTLHRDYTLVDLNRAGVALLEIVTEPCIRSADEAGAFLKKLQGLLRHVGVCDGNMEEGSMRCDVNVSVRPALDDGSQDAPRLLGQRVEMKNLNSVRHVVNAVEFEAARQIEILESQQGQSGDASITGETRTYDATTGTTSRMRRKEAALDYRFMPEPNLPPLVLDDSDIEAAANSMPELLDDIYERFTAPVGADGSAGAKPSYNLSPYDASVLVGEPNAPAFFEVVASGRDPKLAANWVTSELWGRLHAASTPLAESPVSAERLGCMLDLIETGTISGKIGKQVLDAMLDGDARSPAAIVEANNWSQITDPAHIRALCDAVLQDPAHADTVAKVANVDKSGGKGAAKARKSQLGFLVGQALQASSGRASPGALHAAMVQALEELNHGSKA